MKLAVNISWEESKEEYVELEIDENGILYTDNGSWKVNFDKVYRIIRFVSKKMSPYHLTMMSIEEKEKTYADYSGTVRVEKIYPIFIKWEKEKVK